MLKGHQEITKAAEKPRADLADVRRVGELVAFLVAPGVRSGLIDLDLELVLFPPPRRRRLLLRLLLLLLTRFKGRGKTLGSEDGRHPAG
jgi:hypothetical protein